MGEGALGAEVRQECAWPGGLWRSSQLPLVCAPRSPHFQGLSSRPFSPQLQTLAICHPLNGSQELAKQVQLALKQHGDRCGGLEYTF